jgi:hypothetical protein
MNKNVSMKACKKDADGILAATTRQIHGDSFFIPVLVMRLGDY